MCLLQLSEQEAPSYKGQDFIIFSENRGLKYKEECDCAAASSRKIKISVGRSTDTRTAVHCNSIYRLDLHLCHCLTGQGFYVVTYTELLIVLCQTLNRRGRLISSRELSGIQNTIVALPSVAPQRLERVNVHPPLASGSNLRLHENSDSRSYDQR